MKKLIYISCLLIIITPAQAQLSLGGLHAKFGVDAETKAGSMQYYPVNGSTTTDDWFSLIKSNNIKGVIDTSFASKHLAALQSGKNISFVKNMNVPLYTKSNGILLMDAIYMRDHTSALGFDSTCFGSAAKNGVDPRVWDGRPANIPAKTDFVDTYAHFRRNGTKVKDSLWFYTGVSTIGVQGERYFDIELFKNGVTYLPTTGTFNSAGTSFGHTEWLFDAFGNIIQTGDLIIAVAYNSGSAPVIDVRIWVSKNTLTFSKPSLFKFGAGYDSGVPGQVAGYATIVSKTGGTTFGAGIGNYSGTSASDNAYSTPWGTTGANGAWSQNYSQLQFVEIGLNFTRIGIDPAMYTTLFNTACDRIFHSIFFKSRSSNSFSANLQDFAGPITFSIPGLDYSIAQDTLSCTNTTAAISLSNSSTEGEYNWSTLDGNFMDTTNKSNIIVDRKGTYTLTARLIEGCPQTRVDNITIMADSIPPVALADLALMPDGINIQLIGGDTAASNQLTPFGRSKGLLFDWKGPNNFKSDMQNPTTTSDLSWGNYVLTITELRNGCQAYATVDIGFFKIVDNGTLETTGSAIQPVQVSGTSKNSTVELSWKKPSGSNFSTFEVEKEMKNGTFVPIGKISVDKSSYHFIDNKPSSGINTYRIRAVSDKGVGFYSAAVSVNAQGIYEKKMYVVKEGKSEYYLIAHVDKGGSARVMVHGASGQVLGSRMVNLTAGYNRIAVPSTIDIPGMRIITLHDKDQLAFSQKITQ